MMRNDCIDAAIAELEANGIRDVIIVHGGKLRSYGSRSTAAGRCTRLRHTERPPLGSEYAARLAQIAASDGRACAAGTKTAASENARPHHAA
jgi:hypothetical protein